MAVQRNWRGPETMAVIRRNVQTALLRSGLILQTEIKRALNQSGSPSARGSPPGKLTGQLGQSVQVDIARLEELRVRVGVDSRMVPYAAIHEFGGTILPRIARALAVPISKAGRQLYRGLSSLRQADLMLIKRRGKPALLARKASRTSIEPLFVLLPSVTLPPRPYMRPSAKAVRKQIIEEFASAKILTGIP